MINYGPGLVLTRKLSNAISLDSGRIVVQVVQIKGKQVRLKFVCDKEVKIDRLDENGNVEQR